MNLFRHKKAMFLNLLNDFWDSFGTLSTHAQNDIDRACHLLEIKGEFTSQIIQCNYRKLAQIHHPDKGGDHETFQELTWAKEVLSSCLQKN